MKWYFIVLIIIAALAIGFGLSFSFTQEGAELKAEVGGLGGAATLGKVPQ